MKINEIFYSIQGEGKYIGYPAIFIRLSGCNLNCKFCDTNLDQQWEMSINSIIDKIQQYLHKDSDNIIIFTGGEPTLQLDDIIKLEQEIKIYSEEIGDKLYDYSFIYHLETNGTYKDNISLFDYFDYISFSPKQYKDAEQIYKLTGELLLDIDIKIVTDGDELNSKLLPFATILMPLTTFDDGRDFIIKKKVWELCKKLGKRYSPRLQCDIFGIIKGV